ncbi:hypothetical protein APHWI1_0248 [Anaplasma phagocytophilum str. ApWI1]|uniref:Uncharacterized protein n=1 Tax=Anaplasma phagocytophilum str. ApWI1 TaxID=1359155 RepID=A0A0F3PZH8_ANAPH|nr:hypothetical protein APHWEB_1268 [Anaplasma phagocytophilum str. Webster]KJV84574.1 hypothetical protein APHWI1_0248 [Anaplasma phagocytophilum str. ApWI1]KJV87150.1 hypothetical protein APHNYW_0760 [Anaplasma phagocytophilum str. ApNYW]KJZ99657.1 hypothetical protein APHDU1_0045 [Anaplasma phagocytophilum]
MVVTVISNLYQIGYDKTLLSTQNFKISRASDVYAMYKILPL